MARRVVALTLDNASDLPSQCRSCVFWELDPVTGERACRSGDPVLEKEAWLSDTLLQWGSCGFLAYVDERPAGYVLFAPPAYVPRAMGFPTSPISPDSVLLMTGRVEPELLGLGIGRMLVQAVARDAVLRNVRAIEAFARTSPTGPDEQAGPVGDGVRCLTPADYLRSVGFTTVRDHPRTPRLRMDVRTALTWRAEVESALDRLLATSAALAQR